MKRGCDTPGRFATKGQVGNSRGASLRTTLDEGGKIMAKQKSGIRLKAYEQPCVDQSAEKIGETAKELVLA